MLDLLCHENMANCGLDIDELEKKMDTSGCFVGYIRLSTVMLLITMPS